MVKRKRRLMILEAAMIFLAILWFVPIYYLVVTTLKNPREATASPLALPRIPEFHNYVAAWKGAAGIKKFWYLTLPLMCPSVKIIVVTGLIGGMKAFDVIYSMTNGGPGNATQTVMMVIMKKGISDGFYSTGAAFGVCFFVIVLCISTVVTRLMGKWSEAIQ